MSAVENKWLIWSNEHLAWWRPEHHGYCHRRSAAGRYSFAEALEIVRGANSHLSDNEKPHEAMILDDDSAASALPAAKEGK